MSGFGIDLSYDLGDAKLNKLFDDANKSGKANLSTDSNVSASNYGADSASSYNQNSQAQIETLDLSSEVDNANQQGRINTSSQDVGTSPVGSNVAQNTNSSINTPASSNSLDQSSGGTVSSGSNTNSNGFSSSNNFNDNINLTSSSTDSNSSNNLSIGTQNGNDSSNFSSGNSMDMQGDTFSSPVNNNNTSTNMNGTGNLDNNADTDINISSDFSNNSDSSDASGVVIRNGKVYATTLDIAGNVVEVEIDREEYINNLKSYGFTDSDINRILSGEITPEALIVEIQNDSDGMRRNNITICSYLQAFGLDYTNLEQLEAAIASGGEETERLKYIYDYINSVVKYNEECIDKYTSNADFDLHKNYNKPENTVIDEIVNRHKPYAGTSDNDDQKGLLGLISRNVERQVVYETSTSHNGLDKSSTIKEYISEKEDVVDTILCMLNGSTVDGNIVKAGSNLVYLETSDLLLEHYFKWNYVVNDTEKEVINYIYNTQGYDAAYDYLKSLSDVLDNRWLAKKTEEDQAFAEEHHVIASVASIVVTPIEGMAAVSYSLNAFLQGEKIRRVGVYSSGDIWRGQVSQSIAQDYGEKWAFMYNTAMSMGDTATLVALSYATGGMANFVLSATLMGSRAYVSTLNDALDRGISDGAAIGLAFSSAIVETAMESWSVGHLLNLESALGKTTTTIVDKVANSISNPTLANFATKLTYIVSGAISQGICEGEEEFATEIANFIADEIISGDLSNYSLNVDRYIAQEYSEKEAIGMALNDFKNQLGQAFLGGFVSGACFGTFGSVRSTHQISKDVASNIMADFNGTKAQAFAAVVEANGLQQQKIDMQGNDGLNQNVAGAITNQIELSKEDITALMANASVSNFEDKLNLEKLYSVFHSIYDSTFGSDYVNKTLSEFKIIKKENWNQVCDQYGINGQEILGFVDKVSNLYIPENANMHTSVHEGMHKFSEHMKKIITLKDGTTRKVTGIREFFEDGTDSDFANEALTEYLASKYYDGIIYESKYTMFNVRLWERVDEVLTTKYGEGQNILFDAYHINSANSIRAIFDELAGTGTYNKFVTTMPFWYAKGTELNSIVEQLEKAVKPKGIYGKIKNVLKTKPINSSQNSLGEQQQAINFIEQTQNNNLDMQQNISDRIQNAVLDIEVAIQAYIKKFQKNRAYTIKVIDKICKTGDFSYMTSSENARAILQQYFPHELQQALAFFKQDIPYYNDVVSVEDANLRYASLDEALKNVKNPINDYGVLNLLYNIYDKGINLGKGYDDLVRIVGKEAKFIKTFPSVDRVQKYMERFYFPVLGLEGTRCHVQGSHFYHYWSSDFNINKIDQRLYLNMDCNDTLDFLQCFADKCEARNIPYYFKTAPFYLSERQIATFSFLRDESIVIYGSEYMLDYINICNEIMSENPEFETFKPPAITGVINGYLGYGAEPLPSVKHNQSLKNLVGLTDPEAGFSFNSLRDYVLGMAYSNISGNEYNSEQEKLNAYYWQISDLSQHFGIDSNMFFLNSVGN